MIAPAAATTLEKVEALDLTVIVHKLVKEYGWDVDRARDAEHQYRLFLLAAADGLRSQAVLISPPTEDVDEFWHQHILDTRRYCRDCLAVFGEFLHHEAAWWTPVGCFVPPASEEPG